MEGLKARLYGLEEVPIGGFESIIGDAFGTRLRNMGVTEELNATTAIEEAIDRLKIRVPAR